MSRVELVKKSGIQKLFRPFYGGVGHALMFHRVFNTDEKLITKGLQVNQNYIEELIKYFINQKIDIVSLDEFYERITSAKRPKRFVTFTFDDGYLDNFTQALPVFEKYDAPFSVFVTTGYLDNSAFLWWYLLEELVLKKDAINFNYKNKEYNFKTNNDVERRKTFGHLKTLILNSQSLEEYDELMKIILKTSNIDPYSLNKKLMLTTEQTKEFSNHPLVTIGAHTLHHLALSKISEKQVYKEIKESIDKLEKITGKPIHYFAYPYGTHVEAGKREFEIASKCNLKMAFTTEMKNVQKNQSENLFSIPRLGINHRMTLAHIDLYINGLSIFRDHIKDRYF